MGALRYKRGKTTEDKTPTLQSRKVVDIEGIAEDVRGVDLLTSVHTCRRLLTIIFFILIFVPVS